MENNLQIIRVPMPPPSNQYETLVSNAYLIGNEDESLLVDAGYDHSETKDIIEKVIKDNGLATPNSIVLTHAHPDHAPGIRHLTDWSPTVYCHHLELETVKTAISPVNKVVSLEDNETMHIADTEAVVIHGPGHTSGHLSLYIPKAEVLIAGDNIVAEGTTWVGAPDGDMKDYITTLNRLNRLNLTKIGPGHGDWVLHPYEQIKFVLERRLHREEQIKSLLKENKELTSFNLTELIYKDTIHPDVFVFAKRTIEAHLIKLIKDGMIVQKGEVYAID